jgi:signal peptidase II
LRKEKYVLSETILLQCLEDLLKKIFSNYWKLTGIAAVIIFFDQFTKSLVLKNIPLGDMISPIPAFSSFFRFIHWYNTGVAFGMFQGKNGIFIALAVIVSLVIIYYYPHIPANEWPLKIALSMQLAGALGNVIDRIFVGYVVDFISIGNFPVFNVADASITIGVAVLIVGMWIEERNQKIMNQEAGILSDDTNRQDVAPQVKQEPRL